MERNRATVTCERKIERKIGKIKNTRRKTKEQTASASKIGILRSLK
jgi:hypothetical protein